MGKLFGTDGVRGVANEGLTPELAFKLGRAGAKVLAQGKKRPTVLIGKDTRISGAMLEGALIAGITSVGADVLLAGVVPTPAVAYLTRILKADAGIMISASHNPMEDNGIKFFASNGFKLSDATETEIEDLLEQENIFRPTGANLGKVYRETRALELYINFLFDTVDFKLKGLHLAIDCANGAAFQAAPEVLQALGAKVSILNAQPDGVNINANCGSTHPQMLQDYIKKVGADVGFAYDGDADRVLAVDEKGNLVNGDHILAICGTWMLGENQLPHKKLVATVYSNGGLKQFMNQAGGEVIFTQAGDRYVLETMVAEGLRLGGEQSGHVIFLEHNTTGDGILTSLQLLSVMIKQGKPLSVLANQMPVFPQLLKNIPVHTKSGWENNLRIQKAIEQAELKLGTQGRIFVRPSGTESLIRVMGEHEDKQLLSEVIDLVATVIQAEL